MDRPGTDINPDNWPDVNRLFDAAVSLAGDARGAYLDEACRQDPSLRVAVESLLRAHDEAGSFGNASVFPLSGSTRRLAPGSQLGSFRIDSLLGAGGMGEVYRAHDTKLQRAVAIKVLPDSFASDPDRRSRFEEEARALAALNHPHVGAIYGLEDAGDLAALVLELVEGPTLAERLAIGPLTHDEIVRIARQLAEGLEAAHDRGIVHRDLKPDNIKITPDGDVKILDFGLAKLDVSPVRGASTGAATGPRHVTQAGVIVGSPAYMSPEQARGNAVDKRTDIWAFGCVVFTMLARRPPFERASAQDTLTAVMDREPDWSLLPASTPPHLVRLLRRCLTKDPKRRLRDIGEARIALEAGDNADAPMRSPRWVTVVVAGVSVVAGALLVLGLYHPVPAPMRPPLVTFTVAPPAGGAFNIHLGRTFLSLSPDGARLAFLASSAPIPVSATGPSSRIWIREMDDDEAEARPLAGTEGALSAFWSPDGRSLAFFANNSLKFIAAIGGPVATIKEVLPSGWTQGSWGADSVILVGHGSGNAIYAVSVADGTHRQILAPNRSAGEVRVLWPWFLPDGKRFLFTALLDDGNGKLMVGTLDGSAPRPVMSVSSNAQWIDPDIVVFVRDGVLMRQQVDLEGARPIGDPSPIAKQVEYFYTTARGMFATSHTGTVAYHSGGDLEQMVWVDRNGNETGAIGDTAAYDVQSTRLSPDSRELLTARRRKGLGTYDIWRHDLTRQIKETQLTSGRGSEVTPVYIDSGRAIVFAGDSPGSVPHLHAKHLATGAEQQILPPGAQQLVMDVLPGGDAIAYTERQVTGGFRILQASLTGGPTADRLIPPRFNAFEMRVSPDGHAVTFMVSRGGRRDLYVAQLPVTSEPAMVDDDVWSSGRWSHDGRRLYYLGADRTMMTVSIRSGPSLKVGARRKLFELKQSASLLEVSRDGRFLLLVPQSRAAERPIIVSTSAVGAQ